MRREVEEFNQQGLEPRDARALRLQLEQATSAAEAAKSQAILAIRRKQSIEERLAREEATDTEAYPRDRVMEARSEVASLIGILRCQEDPSLLGGKFLSTPEIILRLYKALDRLYRAVDGESYDAQYQRLSDETDGAFHWSSVPDEALPIDLGRPIK